MFKKIYLDPENKTFAEIMSNGKSYQIPIFQRDYAWKNEQIEELWQDIKNIRQQNTQHFMGYLVLQSQDGKKFQVIDGQQRLTTISLIIIAALSRFQQLIKEEKAAEKNQQRLDYYKQTYLGVFDAMTLQTSLKLTLNRNNNGHFNDIINHEPYQVPRRRGITESNRHLNNGLEFFQKKLTSHTDEELVNFIGTLADGLLFTTITVKDDLDAYLVFETLNARGIHLSAPDLLKNYLLSVMSHTTPLDSQFFQKFDEDWNDILVQLGETKFTAFLRSYHGMFDTLRHKNELYRMLKSKISKPDQVMPYLHSIKRHAPIYAALQNPNDSFWREYEDGQYEACIDDLTTLKIFSIKTPLSLLMIAYDKFPVRDFVTVVKWIAIISIRYNVICNHSPNEQEPIYNDLANQIAQEKIKDLAALKKGLMPVYPKDEVFVNAFSLKTMPSRQSPKRVNYLLRQIERHCSQGNEVPINLTLEHVLPRNPTDAWQSNFGLDTYNEAIERLGNIALLPAGQNLDQQPFVEKKTVLMNSGYSINQKIAEHDCWDIEQLKAHQQWLARQAKSVWHID